MGLATSRRWLIFLLVIPLFLITLHLLLLSNSKVPRELGPPPSDEELELFGGDGRAHATRYIQEYLIPIPASRPLGIAVDEEGFVWFSMTREPKLGRLDPSSGAIELIDIPLEEGERPPEAWSLLFDKEGGLWFTDSSNDMIWRYAPEEGTFQRYPLSGEGLNFPIQLVLGRDGKRIWFTEIFGKKLGYVVVKKEDGGARRELVEYEVPTEAEALGGITVTEDGSVWFTMLTYPIQGWIARFDPSVEEFTFYPLPTSIKSPVGLVPSSDGFWVMDHGTSLFAHIDPFTNSTTIYPTALTENAHQTSLPYWVYWDAMGRLWFNEHQGNRIAYFDPQRRILVEYEIPSKSEIWGGISNALQMTIAKDGKVWFTEYSENKVASLDSTEPLPLMVSTSLSVTEVALKPGGEASFNLVVKVLEPLEEAPELKISFSGSLSGALKNLSASLKPFNPDMREPGEYEVKVSLEAEPSLLPGSYILMVGASTKEVSVLIPITLRVG